MDSQHETASGLPTRPTYRPEDVADIDYADLSDPGTFPYTRGVYDTMYRGRHWTMRQYAGFASASESNAGYR